MSESKRRLDERVAIVSAAGRGIGRGIALELAASGARVVVNSWSPETAASTVQQIRDAGGEAAAFPGDATDARKLLELREFTLAEYGQIDILVNNVGAGPKDVAPPEDHELGGAAAIWDALYDQNLRSVMLLTEAVIPHMRERRQGRIINISSIAGRTSLSDRMLAMFVHPSYGAMKAALISYTHTQAELLGSSNITVNAVCPGIVYTDAWKGNAERAVQSVDAWSDMEPRAWFEGIARGDYPEIFDRTPLRREQTVEDVAEAVGFLVSEAAANITGQSLMVDGGMVKT